MRPRFHEAVTISSQESAEQGHIESVRRSGAKRAITNAPTSARCSATSPPGAAAAASLPRCSEPRGGPPPLATVLCSQGTSRDRRRTRPRRRSPCPRPASHPEEGLPSERKASTCLLPARSGDGCVGTFTLCSSSGRVCTVTQNKERAPENSNGNDLHLQTTSADKGPRVSAVHGWAGLADEKDTLPREEGVQEEVHGGETGLSTVLGVRKRVCFHGCRGIPQGRRGRRAWRPRPAQPSPSGQGSGKDL